MLIKVLQAQPRQSPESWDRPGKIWRYKRRDLLDYLYRRHFNISPTCLCFVRSVREGNDCLLHKGARPNFCQISSQAAASYVKEFQFLKNMAFDWRNRLDTFDFTCTDDIPSTSEIKSSRFDYDKCLARYPRVETKLS